MGPRWKLKRVCCGSDSKNKVGRLDCKDCSQSFSVSKVPI